MIQKSAIVTPPLCSCNRKHDHPNNPYVLAKREQKHIRCRNVFPFSSYNLTCSIVMKLKKSATKKCKEVSIER
ncbi:hypothetical protein HMPREF3190_00839 [Umbribacter vaginalis]|nr:hypothetical protein HMPREF3190_00839 [Coriobacteriales bacterium DNF00809]